MSKQITNEFLIFSLTAGFIFLSTVCLASPKSGYQQGTYNGPAVDIGRGSAHSFVTLDADGKPGSIGVKFSTAVLKDLPTEPSPGSDGWEYKLKLPDEAKSSGYDHIGVDWNPKGHIPEGVYNIPHFDFHFYLINEDERNLITAVNEDLERTNRQPDPNHMPEGYILPPGTETPRMGAHAIDPASGEFNGKPFTTTFIYGFYDGRMIFIEPMVSESYLNSEPDFSAPVAVPKAYALHAFYPTRYSVRYDGVNKDYIISLENLAARGTSIHVAQDM